jgi:hypothetical protein
MKLKNYVDPALAEFAPDAVTVRVSHAIFGAVPFAPKQPNYGSLGECIQAFYPQLPEDKQTLVFKLAQGENVSSALSVASAIDTGDTGIAVYSGVQSALTMFFGKGTKAIDTDSEQGVDAAMKLLGLAYIIHKLFAGSVSDKASAFYTTPAGQGLAYYYASVDVALPFADNLLSAGGNVIETLIARHGGAAAGKISMLPGGAAIASTAQSMLGSIIAPIEGAVRQVTPYVSSIAGSAMQHLPGVMSAADKALGAVAAGADVLPFYRYLVARLAAESCVLNASRGQTAG